MSPLPTFSITVLSLLIKGALSSGLYVALIVNCWIVPIMIWQKRYFLVTSSNNFKIINALINYILSSKRFGEPLFWINSFISKSKLNQQSSFLHIYLLLLLVILYSQVLFGILVSGDCVILLVCVSLPIFYVKWSVNL